MKLLSRVSDDSGAVSAVEEIKLGGRTIARLEPVWFASPAGPKTVGIAWKVPASAAGTYKHCVRAVDRAANSSAQSCAPIVIK